MSEIIPTNSENVKSFNFNGHDLQILTIEGEPYFIANDVCSLLLYKNIRDAIGRHCKGVVKHDTLTTGGKQSVSIIPERDLYRLVMRSKLPEAEKFEDWVVSDVLPQIRKTGSYAPTKELSRLELIDMARESEVKAIELSAQLDKAQPAIEFKKLITASTQVNTCRNAGKLLKQRPNKFCQWLLNNGYTYESSQGRTASQASISLGILELDKSKPNQDGKTYPQVFVTDKGLIYFADKLGGIEL